MCLKSTAELEICSSKRGSIVLVQWYHICWYMFAKYPPLWWWKTKKNKTFLIQSHVYVQGLNPDSSLLNLSFLMIKSIQSQFFRWKLAPFHRSVPPAGPPPPVSSSPRSVRRRGYRSSPCPGVSGETMGWILCHDYQRLSGLGFQNHIMNQITSPQNKDTSTSTTIIPKGSGTKSRLNPHKLSICCSSQRRKRLGPCTLQVEAAQERHFGLKFLICVWPNQKKNGFILKDEF